VNCRILPALALSLFVCCSALGIDADSTELEGYTLVANTRVTGQFEGADPDKPVALDNGMIFNLSGYSYTYSYAPRVAIFAITYTAEQARQMGIKDATGPMTLYKLLIKEKFYRAFRLR
jgi:hypothetical protein